MTVYLDLYNPTNSGVQVTADINWGYSGFPFGLCSGLRSRPGYKHLQAKHEPLDLSLVPQGRVGENTWNARLSEELHKRGFKSADFELHFPILRGRPRKPDVAFANGGTHLVSGKLGEKNEFEAFSSAQEYQQLIGATTNLGEVFAVVYPSSRREAFLLHLLANQSHERKAWRLLSLEETADVVCEIVQKRIDYLKRPSEPLDASVVRLLRQGVEIP